ncbi:MAG: collagen-like triple helix repeat-containing protein, partial [Candidatus Dojkabacteria bacterium]|nr:collagen-like triple helix repeat-containing protein [Candidatus Dojkabacteria bacterium]
YCNNAGDVGYLDKSFILGTTFEDINGNINDLGTTVGGIGSDVANLGTSLSDIGSDVSDLGGAVSGIGLSLSDLDVSIADLGLTITGEEITDLTTLSHLITGIQTTVDSIETKIDQFTEIETKIDTLIAKWGELEAEDLYDQSLSIADEIEDLGTLEVSAPSAQLSGTDSADIKTIKNTVLSMKALIEINRNYLETLSNRPIVETWLEEGSIVFKTLITNPSPTADQMVAVDYYLPREVQQEHIQHIDDGLSSSYDTERDALRITGSFTLAPQETRTFTVEVDDIWTIDEQEVASLRKQARELAGPLEGTSYFSQGSLLTSDINASLDTVLGLVDETAAPQTRILNYRKAQIELSAVKEKIKALETLVVSAGSMNTMFGYIGGSQTYATWGIMVVLLGGFVFLTLYTRSLLKKEKSVKKEDLSIVTPPK